MKGRRLDSVRRITISIADSHDQPFGVFAVRANGLGAKVVKCCQRAAGGDFEDCPAAVGPAPDGCSIEVPVGRLDYRVRAKSVHLVEAVQRGEILCWQFFLRGRPNWHSQRSE
jgi:hypothetical protein